MDENNKAIKSIDTLKEIKNARTLTFIRVKS